MGNLNVEFNKTGEIVDFEGVLPNVSDKKELMYVYGLRVGDVVYKCHYTTKEDLDIEVGDYAMVDGDLFDIDFGFVSMGIIRVHDMVLLKKKKLKEFCKDNILVLDFHVRGQKSEQNQQNGFVISKKEVVTNKGKTEHKEKTLIKNKRYGLFYISGLIIGVFHKVIASGFILVRPYFLMLVLIPLVSISHPSLIRLKW